MIFLRGHSVGNRINCRWPRPILPFVQLLPVRNWRSIEPSRKRGHFCIDGRRKKRETPSLPLFSSPCCQTRMEFQVGRREWEEGLPRFKEALSLPPPPPHPLELCPSINSGKRRRVFEVKGGGRDISAQLRCPRRARKSLMVFLFWRMG